MFNVHLSQGNYVQSAGEVRGTMNNGYYARNEQCSMENREHWFFRGFVVFVRFWGVVTAIVLGGVGIDFAFHRHVTGYYLIAGSIIVFFLEITWAVTLFVQLCARNKESRSYHCWMIFAVTFEGWKKTIIYGPMSAVPLVWPYDLWLSYVAGGQLIALALFHFTLTFRERQRRKRRNKLMHGEGDSFESKFEEVTDILDDGLPQPIPGSSHSLSDSLTEQDAILEI